MTAPEPIRIVEGLVVYPGDHLVVRIAEDVEPDTFMEFQDHLAGRLNPLGVELTLLGGPAIGQMAVVRKGQPDDAPTGAGEDKS